MPSPYTLPPDFPDRLEQAVLSQETTARQIVEACLAVREYQIGALVVNPCWITLGAEQLADSRVRIVAVCGFPLGANRTDIKVAEAVEAVEDGAYEIDVVANIGWLMSGNLIEAEAEIRRICRNVSAGTVVKVIVEVSKLSQTVLPQVVTLVANAGGQYVKTGTGLFGPATVEQVSALKCLAPPGLAIKASGGIRSLEDCAALLAAGADRLGSSCCPQLVAEWRGKTGPA